MSGVLQRMMQAGASRRSGAALWTPLDDLPDLWFRASDINQSNTATWTESQGRLVLTRGANNVSFTTFGTQTAVSFNNATGYTGAYSVSSLNRLTIIAFGNRPQNSGSSLDPIVAWQTVGNFTNDILFCITENSAVIFAQVNTAQDGSFDGTLPSISASGMFMAKYDGTQSSNANRISISFNESILSLNPGYTAPTAISSSAPTTFRISNYNNDAFFNGSLSDIMIYRRAISTDLQQRLAGWSSWTSGAWSLPSSHPYKSSPPTV